MDESWWKATCKACKQPFIVGYSPTEDTRTPLTISALCSHCGQTRDYKGNDLTFLPKHGEVPS